MTELQHCEYDLLKRALKIINENNLKYYLVCGTALGAVKYGGFIPWDDDIDIALPRKDYELFVDLMAACDDEAIAIQNYRFDPNVPFFYSKIRANNTTYIEKTVSRLNINHGVFIDVFPLDGYPNGLMSARLFELKKKIVWRLLSSVYFRDSSWKNLVVYPIKKVVDKKVHSLVKYYERLVSSVDVSRSDLMCNFGNSPSKSEYAPKWHYGDGIAATFEGLEVRIPENYDAYLTQKYGDWRADLPKEQQVGHHYYEVLDLNKPYTEYCKEGSSK